MPVDPEAYRRVVGRFATGVTVATTIGADGVPVTLTANAFLSVSLDPLLALLSVQRSSHFHEAALVSGVWGVSVLAEEHEGLSRFHASAVRHELDDQFDGVQTTLGPVTGVVLIADALATLECRTVGSFPGGDHTLLVGAVEAAELPRPGGRPLIFFAGRYRALADFAAQSEAIERAERGR